MNRRASNIFRRTGPQASQRLVDATEGLEHASGLDRVIGVLSGAVRRTLRPGPVKDALHGVPAGHPAHPPLTDVPMGCWISAAVLDLMPGTRRASQALVAVGLAGAVPAALTGLADWSALHREQQRVGLVHAAGTATASVLYSASLVARSQGRDGAGRAFGFAGLTALMAGGYLGGHLAFRQAAGASHADQVAHLVGLGWHDLCPADDLPDGWPVHRRLGYISLFVLRSGDEIHVLADRCSHLAGPLHQGRIVTDDAAEACVVCPWHGSTFRVRDGSVVHGPATGRQPVFESRVTDEGLVQVRPLG
ncbi:Rieske 2Fe-2S domain-containing protein [Actinomadura roseirufa]|uniref:Rieske 2Fe-2S domain-containing protein n=1 Tax=Actinomadura roseirufa TaxID=2094049 RepID=UPI0010413A9B|nr:Rieske 2Fe-2S domain-containing protein [Actinomadura roseirufa]